MKLPLFLLAALFCCTVTRTMAQTAGGPPPSAKAPSCSVCSLPVSGQFFVHVADGVTNNICAICEQLPNRCSQCRLPVKEGFTKTADGRFFCKQDAARVVLSEDEARQLFATARTELRELAGGALELRQPQVNVQVLFNLDFADTRSSPDAGTPMHRMGFSMSRPQGDGFAHNVVLLSGQPRTTTLSTCAHEFGHLWLTENLKPGRKLNPDSREALCELFAFKLAARRGDTNEQARIKANPYTKGAILGAIEFEAREGLPGVIKWVREGAEELLPAPGNSVMVAAAPAAAEPPRELRPPPPPATKLELRSLLRTTKRTVAVINGERFELGTEIPLLVGGQRHLVRLEEAQPNAVTVSVDGVRQTLRLGEK